MQTFTAPLTTNYKIECWGASGGNSYSDGRNPPTYTNTVYGGKGGYCSGWITFFSNFSIKIYVGQSGEGTREKTFNGGGKGGAAYNGLSGGGATDLRLTGGEWNNFGSLKSRIIVAAGGSGAQHHERGSDGGYAGGLSGQDGSYSTSSSNPDPFSVATGAGQTSGGTRAIGPGCGSGTNGLFGIGGDFGFCWNVQECGSGGGGGYYGGGGGAAASCIVGSGSGGSSFISGYTGCDAITESSTENNIIHTGQSNHYSGKVFTNPIMIDGGSVMPSPTGSTETGHTGNGYCIITWQQLP